MLAALSLCGQVLFAVGAIGAVLRYVHLAGSVFWVSAASAATALAAGGAVAMLARPRAEAPIGALAAVWAAAALALFLACR